MISFSQIKQIHTLKAIVRLDDELYKEMLMGFGVATCKDLTYTEAEIFLDILSEKAIAAGKWQRPRSNFIELENRGNDMATPAQLRKIEAMWRDISYIKSNESVKKSLRIFLQKHFKISDLRFVDKTTATKIIHAINKINIGKIKKELKAF